MILRLATPNENTLSAVKERQKVEIR